MQLIRSDVKIDGSTIFISFSPAVEGWPFMIENDSDYTATICQKVRLFIPQRISYLDLDQDSGSEDEGAATKVNVTTYSVKSRSSLSYAWDFPAAADKKILLSINGFRRAIDIMEIGDLVPFKFHVRSSFRC